MKRLEGRLSSLNGELFRRAVIAGARRVIAHREALNRINVFPVPDADTGTNLAATMRAVVRGLRAPEPSLAAVSESVAVSALSGARGNSGVIMAQFFQGLHEGIADSVQVSITRFVSALRRAAQSAREALSRPEEGTILTVMTDVADHLERHAERASDFRALMTTGLRVARRSLARTIDQLSPLRRAGVVDAGALGFVRFLEGVVQFIRGEEGNPTSTSDEAVVPVGAPTVDAVSERVTFRYCAEALVSGNDLSAKVVRDRLAAFGDSIVVAGGSDRIHVHIHTNAPAHVRETLADFGRVRAHKAQDMFAQLSAHAAPATRTGIALVTDSVCDLPQAFLTRHRVQVVPLRIAFDRREYRDRVDLTPRQFYDRLKGSSILPKTSQPTPGEFLALYRYLARFHEAILSIHLSSSVSGTAQSAQSAARRVGDETGVQIEVMDTRLASAAEGLCVWAAARSIESGLPLHACRDAVEALAGTTRVFVFVPTVEYFVRGGRLSRVQGGLARLLHLKPILTMRDGQVVPAAKAIGTGRAVERTLALAVEHAGRMNLPAFVIAHSAAPVLAQRYAQRLRERFPNSTVMTTDAAPALGSHAGPGGAAIAVCEADRIETAIRQAEAG